MTDEQVQEISPSITTKNMADADQDIELREDIRQENPTVQSDREPAARQPQTQREDPPARPPKLTFSERIRARKIKSELAPVEKGQHRG